MVQSRVVKKYANRKLYDTADRHYVTRQTVAALVEAGTKVRVIDQVSGADITERTLGGGAAQRNGAPPRRVVRGDRITLELPRQLVGRAVAALAAPATAELRRRWPVNPDEVAGLQRQLDVLRGEVRKLRAEVATLHDPHHRAVP